jgi:DNA-binding NarL/FixJ family response regulator
MSSDAEKHDTKIIKLLIADDQVLFAESLRYVIKGIDAGIEVLEIAPDGERALELAEEHRPDVILMDVRMPRIDGVEATRLIHRKYPDIKIVMLTTFDDDEYVYFAVKYGAVGYLMKNIRPNDLVHSIKAVLAGATLFTRSISSKVVKASEGAPGDMDTLLSDLTAREKDVLNLVMDMRNNRQIAERLSLSEQTVRNYMHSLYDAFEVKDRMELIQRLKDAWPMVKPQ